MGCGVWSGDRDPEQTKEHWQVYKSPEAAFITDSFQCEDNRWTSFSALPLVIMYNTNVVTYRELPVGWNSLLEPRWKGRIAFVDPRRSDVYSAALVTAVHTWEKKGIIWNGLWKIWNMAPWTVCRR